MSRKANALAPALIVMSLAAGCSNSLAPLGQPATRTEMLVSTDWLARRLGDRDVVVIHVARDGGSYEAGHIPGARFVGWHELAATWEGIPNELPPLADLTAMAGRLGIDGGQRIVIYDAEQGLHAARAYVALDYLGLGDRSALLDGQLSKWRAEARPLSSEPPQVTPTSFAPRPGLGAIVPHRQMKDLVWARNSTAAPIAIIDARSRDEYTGATPGQAIQRPGHIPGAASVFWMQHIVSSDEPVLKSPAQLRRLYASAGVKADDLVVTYCRTGVQASHAYFTLKYLGYDARLYDGSYVQWSADPDTTVVAGP